MAIPAGTVDPLGLLAKQQAQPEAIAEMEHSDSQSSEEDKVNNDEEPTAPQAVLERAVASLNSSVAEPI